VATRMGPPDSRQPPPLLPKTPPRTPSPPVSPRCLQRRRRRRLHEASFLLLGSSEQTAAFPTYLSLRRPLRLRRLALRLHARHLPCHLGRLVNPHHVNHLHVGGQPRRHRPSRSRHLPSRSHHGHPACRPLPEWSLGFLNSPRRPLQRETRGPSGNGGRGWWRPTTVRSKHQV